ncbi:rhodanese-like domain-containing protein [Acidobacteriota bacterium]
MKNVFILGLTILMLVTGVLGQEIKDITSKEAYEMAKEDSTYIIDVRSIAEYAFIGHPKMAYSIPLSFWNEEKQSLVLNETFVEDIKAKFTPEDSLIFICRSGGRSRQAAQHIVSEGYGKIFNILHGFEGDRDDKGYRNVNGWKNSDLPFTYKREKEYIYKKK